MVLYWGVDLALSYKDELDVEEDVLAEERLLSQIVREEVLYVVCVDESSDSIVRLRAWLDVVLS